MAQQNGTAKPRRPSVRESAIAPWLATSDEGLSILGAALESRESSDPNADCSNLVHEIYNRAGFTYDYANSSQLYAGIKEFHRVIHPQPGDLVVWRGHVGIVVSPRQHTFFSSMRSGRGVEPYTSTYWQARGRPRFFRYLKSARRNPVAAVKRTSAKTHAHEPTADPAPVPEKEDETLPSTPSDGETKPPASEERDQKQQVAVPTGDPIKAATDAKAAPAATTVKPSAGIPFGSAGVAAKNVPQPPSSFGKAAKAATTQSAANSTRIDLTQRQVASRAYVPRPPWSSADKAPDHTVPRPPAGWVPQPALPGR